VASAGFVVAQILSPEPPAPRVVTASMSSPERRREPPGTNRSTTSAPITPAVTKAPTIGAPAAAPFVGDRRLSLHQGRFQLDPGALPVMGSTNAENFVVMISDYTCRYCRAAHRVIQEVRDTFG